MKIQLSLILCALIVAGCGDEGAIKGLVKERLKDPGSAQFKEVVYNETKTRACIEWNSKNSFGGYTDWKSAHIVKRTDKWALEDMEWTGGSCSPGRLILEERRIQAVSEADKYVLEYVLLNRKITPAEANRLITDGQCKEAAKQFKDSYVKGIRESVLWASQEDYVFNGRLIDVTRDSLKGDCSYSPLQLRWLRETMNPKG